MKISRLLTGVALVAAFSIAVYAQQAPSGYHRVACIKIKPDKGSEFRKWAAEDVHKLAQARVDSGALSGWLLLRSEIPQGQSADCDYIVVSMYPGVPAEPMGLEGLSPALKKAGIAMTAQEYVDRRGSLTTLISNNLFQNQAFVGTYKKGDYFVVNYMKTSNFDDYVALEKKIWMPMAEQMAKDGTRSGWSLNTLVFPGGTDVKYNAVTVDVYPSWNSIYNVDFAKFGEMWRKVHPDMEVGTSFEQYDKLRHQGDVNVYVLQDLVASTK